MENRWINSKMIGSKMRRMKKVLAVSLAVVTAFSTLPANPAAVQAAKPYVSLRTSFKTLQTGQVNRMTLKNNTIGWQITKVSTQDRTIAMVYGKTKSSFMIKGKKEGRATVRAKLKTAARKTFNSKTVRCRVRVTAKEEASNPAEAVVSTQEELEKALLSKNLKKLEIKTDQSGRLTIPKGSYPDVELSVHAPAADIENNGVFKSITIQAIKPDTWIENAIGNIMRVTAETARIIVNQGASLEQLNFTRADAKISLEVNGTIGQVSISAKMELTVSGSPQAPINTVIEESAEGTVIESSAPLQITANASADITFHEGAENSSIDVKSKDAKVEVKNNTNATITIRKPDGTIESRQSTKISLSRPSSGGSGSSSTRPNVTTPVTPGAVVTTGGALDTDDTGNTGDTGDTGNIYYPGDSGGSISSSEQFPALVDFARTMNPVITVTITRPAITGSVSASAVSMSSIVTLNLKPEAVPLEHNGKIWWSWKDDEESEYKPYQLMENKTADFAFDPQSYADLALTDDSPIISLDVSLRYQYDRDGIIYEQHTYRTVYLSIYDKTVLDKYLEYMDNNNLTTVTLKLPLLPEGCQLMEGYSIINYKYDEAYITASSKLPESSR